jgi:hypothetical protein
MEEVKKQGMESLFVPYEIALALKELGFDEPCLGNFYTKPNCKMFGVDEKGRHYTIKNTPKKLYTLGEHFVLNDSNVINAPLYQQAFRWFREKYELVVDWNHSNHDNFGSYIGVCIKNIHFEETIVGVYKSYEEAELECLKKLIEITKRKIT